MSQRSKVSCRIGVLVACHQQREQVIDCIGAVYGSQGLARDEFDIYLVDDGSTDGTTAAVRRLYPDVRIFDGSGTLFWNQSMRAAFDQARSGDYDHLLWLNSDAVVAADAVHRLIEIAAGADRKGPAAMVAGATIDPDTSELSSSGFRIRGPRAFLALEKIKPAGCTLPVATADGTCLLVPRAIYECLGNLSPAFSHSLGDMDYGLRAGEQGFRVLLAPGTFGTSPALRATTYSPRLRDIPHRLRHPKGLVIGGDRPVAFMPEKEWRIFLRRHAGPAWRLAWSATYLKLAWLTMRRRRRPARRSARP